MATTQNQMLIEQLFNEVMNDRKFSLLDQIIDPAFVNHGIPDAKQGPSGFKQVIEQFLDGFPDMKIQIEQIVSEKDLVATRGYWTGTNSGSFMGMPSSGKKVRIDYIDFWKIKNGKCVENWVQMDMMSLMQQVGAMQATA